MSVIRSPMRSPIRSVITPVIRVFIPRPLFFMPLISDLSIPIGTGPATFTRATEKRYLKPSTGLITVAAIDEAAFEANGILIEGASTNEALHSRDFTNAVWIKTNITPAKDAIGADGVANSASTLTATAANGTAFQTVTKLSAENTYSIDVRRKTGTGTIEITDDGGSTFTDVTSSINSSTYSRFEITTTQANPSFGVRIVTSGDEVEADYTGLEVLPFASSRIETVASTVTRAADELDIPSANFVSATSPYTITAEVDVIGANGSTSQQFVAAFGGADRVQILRGGGSAEIRTRSGTGASIIDSSPPTFGTLQKLALTGTGGPAGVSIQYVDGSNAGTDVDDRSDPITGISVGYEGSSSANYLFGHIKNLRIYDVALSQDQVAAL